MKTQGFSLVEAMIALGVLGVIAGATGALTLQTQKSVRATQLASHWTQLGSHAVGLFSSGGSCTAWITNPDFFPQQLPSPFPSAQEPQEFQAIGAQNLVFARTGQTLDGIHTVSLQFWKAMDLSDGQMTLALRWRAKKEAALGAELPGAPSFERTFLIRASISPSGQPLSCEGLTNIESCASIGGIYNASAEPPCQLPQLTVASSAAGHEAGREALGASAGIYSEGHALVNGRLGVGTSNPLRTVHVSWDNPNPDGTQGQVVVENRSVATTSGNARIQFRSGKGGGGGLQFAEFTPSNDAELLDHPSVPNSKWTEQNPWFASFGYSHTTNSFGFGGKQCGVTGCGPTGLPLLQIMDFTGHVIVQSGRLAVGAENPISAIHAARTGDGVITLDDLSQTSPGAWQVGPRSNSGDLRIDHSSTGDATGAVTSVMQVSLSTGVKLAGGLQVGTGSANCNASRRGMIRVVDVNSGSLELCTSAGWSRMFTAADAIRVQENCYCHPGTQVTGCSECGSMGSTGYTRSEHFAVCPAGYRAIGGSAYSSGTLEAATALIQDDKVKCAGQAFVTSDPAIHTQCTAVCVPE